jgi:peptide subunit release factor RF-3
VTGPKDEIERVARSGGRSLIYDVKGNPVVLFTDAWDLRWAMEREKAVQWHEVAP